MQAFGAAIKACETGGTSFFTGKWTLSSLES